MVTQGAANFLVGLQKSVLPAPLYGEEVLEEDGVTHERLVRTKRMKT